MSQVETENGKQPRKSSGARDGLTKLLLNLSILAFMVFAVYFMTQAVWPLFS